jgi:hypothetical protein
MLLLAAVGVVGRQIQKKFQQQRPAASHRHGVSDAEPMAAPFEAHVQGDSVTYQADDPTPRHPDDPNEPFSGRALQ